MSFAGSVLAMIQTLKNNARPKRKAFSSWEKDQNERISQKTKLRFKEVSAEELQNIKEKIRKEARLRRKRTYAAAIIVILALMGLGTFITIKYSGTYTKPVFPLHISEVPSMEKKREASKSKLNKKILFQLNDGYKWLEEEHYKNAIFQFQATLAIDPENEKAKFGLLYALVYDCLINETACQRAEAYYASMSNEFKGHPNLIDLEIIIQSKKILKNLSKTE